MEMVPVELKYCEMCGKLGSRESNSSAKYCAKCTAFDARSPKPSLCKPGRKAGSKNVGRVGAWPNQHVGPRLWPRKQIAMYIVGRKPA